MCLTAASARICASSGWRLSLAYVLVALVGSPLLIGCSTSAAPSESADTASIYAAVIRQIYTNDDTFGGTYKPQTMYVVSKTETRAGETSPQAAEPAPISEVVQGAIAQQLHDVPAAIMWVASSDAVPRNADGMVANHGAIITIGPIARQSGRSVRIPASIFVAPLAAGGRTYIVEQNQAGTWQITGTTGEEWIS